MKLVRYGEAGLERPGMLLEDGSIGDLSAYVDDINGDVLAPEGLARMAAIDPTNLPRISEVPRLGPPVSGTRSFVCIGLNYVDHAAEASLPLPEEPLVFLKSTGSICGPADDIIIPPGAQKTDWELELALVIGSTAQRVAEDRALEHVAGYMLCNEVSERSWQLERGGTWAKGKSFDSFGQIGPWLVTLDEVDDPHDLTMTLLVDGVPRQSAATRNMIFSVAHIVSYVSQFMTLYAGDIISTGTPAGVGMGMKPPQYLKAGQMVELSCPQLGRQIHRVITS